MYAARGIAVSLSVFVLVYSILSAAVGSGWRYFWLCLCPYLQKHRVQRIADFLYAVRLFPLIAAALVTALFTIPSFLLLEPRTIDEPFGALPLGLGVCGMLLGVFGMVNAAFSLRRAGRAVSSWKNQSRVLDASARVPVLKISPTQPSVIPAMTAAGIMRPMVFFSEATEFVLTANELQIALNHELAHLQRRDNLKKLLLRVVAFPGMQSLGAAWIEASEMAADDAAVSDASDALDLAAALIKLSRLIPVLPPVDLTAALLHAPVSTVNVRVERLIAWEQNRSAPTPRDFLWYAAPPGIAAVALVAITYTPLLQRVHAATEWLVR